MFKLLVGIIIGLALVVGGWWYYSDGGRRDPVDGFQDAVKFQGRQAVQAVEQKVGESVDSLKATIDQTGQKISQTVSDTTLLATIKAKLLREESLDGLKIRVEVTEGVVNLKGTVPSLEARALAIKLARETEGVQGVRADLPVEYPTRP
jgi:hyperosmotically inducible periplasmic protein